ncbi:MAG: hypothetical protein QXQ29_00245 [Candidatus Bathyarchaeia archaeon]
MSFIRVKFGVFNPLSPTKTIVVDGIVGTGAIYSVIPRGGLEELSVKPIERRFRAFSGYVEKNISEIRMEIMRGGGW